MASDELPGELREADRLAVSGNKNRVGHFDGSDERKGRRAASELETGEMGIVQDQGLPASRHALHPHKSFHGEARKDFAGDDIFGNVRQTTDPLHSLTNSMQITEEIHAIN